MSPLVTEGIISRCRKKKGSVSYAVINDGAGREQEDHGFQRSGGDEATPAGSGICQRGNCQGPWGQLRRDDSYGQGREGGPEPGAGQPDHGCRLNRHAGGRSMTLKDLKPGQQGTVASIGTTGPAKRRIMDMGITPGVEIRVVKVNISTLARIALIRSL